MKLNRKPCSECGALADNNGVFISCSKCGFKINLLQYKEPSKGNKYVEEKYNKELQRAYTNLLEAPPLEVDKVLRPLSSRLAKGIIKRLLDKGGVYNE